MGLPKSIFSENGPQFASVEFRRFCQRNSIKNRYTPIYSPKSNGQAERLVRTTKYVVQEAKRQKTKFGNKIRIGEICFLIQKYTSFEYRKASE